MMEKKKALKWLCIFIAAELAVIALITYVFDPFYQYHTPFFGIKQVLNDRDNQVVGTIRNNTYDTVILGSSMAENYDSTAIDKAYDCQTLKVIKTAGSTADLLYYMEKVHKAQDIERVFWSMDLFSLFVDTETTLYDDDVPRYLHTETILDDAQYLFNKDILFKTIPQSLALSYLGKNTGGNAYNWAEDKDFSVSGSTRFYIKSSEVIESTIPDEFLELLDANIALIEEELTNHPDVEYTVIFPPYSLLWWDSGYANGLGEQYFYTLDKILPFLLSHDNVKVYYFQDERDIVCDLSNYMDILHYSPAINQYMLDCIFADTNRVTEENWKQYVADMRATYEYIIEEGIYLYYERD